MGNIFFQPGNARAAKVKALFSSIAPRYDLLNDLQSFGLHRRWKRRVTTLAQAIPGIRALDVCCGTGDLALALARRGAEVVGLDFSEPMLAIAEERKGKGKISVPGLHNPRFIHGDAQNLPFADNEFEVVTVGYGLRNLANWEAGLNELRRVAKPGGRLLVLDFGKPGSTLWRWLYFGYLKLVVPRLGRIFCGSFDAYAYILESLKHYPEQGRIAARMREMGLTNVRVVNFLGGVMAVVYGEKGAAGKGDGP